MGLQSFSSTEDTTPCTGCSQCQWMLHQRPPCIQYNPCSQYYDCPPVHRPTTHPRTTKRPAQTTTKSATRSTTQSTPSTQATPTRVTTPTPQCVGNNTFTVSGTEYYLSPTYTGLSWYQADSKATSLARLLGTTGYMWKLAKLNTRRQMEQLKQALNNEGCSISGIEMWIGGNDLADENQWVWTDGDLVSGDLWASDPGDGDCMAMRDYTWYQRQCEGHQLLEGRFLAMKESLPPPRTTITPTSTTRKTTSTKTTTTTKKSTARPTARPSTTPGGEQQPPTQA